MSSISKTGRLRSGVPAPTGHLDASHFIEAAPGKENLPWKRAGVRDDLQVSLNVRIPERISLKVAWLSATLDMPKREVVEEALSEWAQRKLGQLGIPDE